MVRTAKIFVSGQIQQSPSARDGGPLFTLTLEPQERYLGLKNS